MVFKKFCFIASVLQIILLAQPALAVEYGGIGGRPAYPQADNPRTDSIFVHTLTPGQVQDEGVLLINNGTEAKDLLVYAVDSQTSSDGAFACKQLSDPKTDVGQWIALDKTEVTLDPGTNQIVPFKITVPDQVDVGEHNGCVVIQENKADATGQTGVSLSFRTGIRVAVTVPGDIVRKLAITGFSEAVGDNGSNVLSSSVENSGNVSIDAEVATKTHNLFGQAYSQQGGTSPVLRGETSQLHYDLAPSFWGGLYQSTLTLQYDAHPEASIGDDSGKGKEVLTSTTGWFFMKPALPAMVIEMCIGLAILVVVGLVCIWYKRRKWMQTRWVAYTVKSGQDIKQLAIKFKVSWKLLAQANQLKAPYTLKAKTSIKVPPEKKPKAN